MYIQRGRERGTLRVRACFMLERERERAREREREREREIDKEGENEELDCGRALCLQGCIDHLH
jgi:hypothetical protein